MIKNHKNVKETIKILGIEEKTIYRYIKNGIIYPEKIENMNVFKTVEIMKIKKIRNKLLKNSKNKSKPGRNFIRGIQQILNAERSCNG